jgi:ferrous iron transport protein B
MGRSDSSAGMDRLRRKPERPDGESVVALGGNPNVGKSTVFNGLTGLKQHTGNWPGKTVANARGRTRHGGKEFILVDLPGTYSLMASSAEEEIARDFICFGKPDAVVIVTDATCLERNLYLVLQTLEITRRVVVCVNLMDEAARKGIKVDLERLSEKLGIPVVGTNARSNRGLDVLMDAVRDICNGKGNAPVKSIDYGEPIERALAILDPLLRERLGDRIDSRWAALRILDADEALLRSMEKYLGLTVSEDRTIALKTEQARGILRLSGLDETGFADAVASRIVNAAEDISRQTVTCSNVQYNRTDRRMDQALTSRVFGIPIMILSLGLVFG